MCNHSLHRQYIRPPYCVIHEHMVDIINLYAKTLCILMHISTITVCMYVYCSISVICCVCMKEVNSYRHVNTIVTLTINAVWPAWHVNMHSHPAHVACLGMPCTLLCSVSVAGGSLWEAVEECTAHNHWAGKKLHQSHQAGDQSQEMGLQIELRVVLTQPLQLNRFLIRHNASCLAC